MAAADENFPSYIVDVRNKTVGLSDAQFYWIDSRIAMPIDKYPPRELMPYEAVDLPDPKLKLSRGFMSFTGLNRMLVGTCRITVSY